MAVQPVVDELVSGGGFGLGDLVFVMGEDVVYAAAVDIERFAQVLGAHGRAFDVPSRPAGADLGLPERLSLFFRLPEGKVMASFLLILVYVHPLSRLEFLEADLGKPAVGRELGAAEIGGAVFVIGVPLLDEPSDERD